MTFNKYHNKTIIVDRDIGDACVICCLYIASIFKGFVEARVVRMLLKQAAKLLQSGGLEGLTDGAAEMEAYDIAETEMKMKAEVKTEDKLLGEV
jgi:hypothetical protein